MTYLTTTQLYKHTTGTSITKEYKLTKPLVDVTKVYGADHVDWLSLLKRHRSAQTSMVVTAYEDKPAVMGGQVTYSISGVPKHTWTWDGYYPYHHSLATLCFSARAEENAFVLELAKEFNGKVESEIMGFMEFVFIKEIHKTLQLLAHPLDGIVKLIRQLAKSLLKLNPRYFNKEVASLYLSFQMAVKPLLGEVRQLSEEFAIKVGHEQFTRMATINERTFMYSTFWNPSDSDCGVTGYPMKIGADYTRYSRMWVEHRGVISSEQVKAYYNARPGAFNRELIQEFKQSIWELVRFSFLVDYFVHADKNFLARRQLSGLLAYSFTRVKRETTLSYRLHRITGAGQVNYVDDIPLSEDTGRIVSTVKHRYPLVTGFEEVPFSFDTDLSSAQKINIAALLAQKL